jgi:hypothetical protein
MSRVLSSDTEALDEALEVKDDYKLLIRTTSHCGLEQGAALIGRRPFF